MELDANMFHFRRNSSRHRGVLATLFPIDGQRSFEKVINHPASKELYSFIQANQGKRVITKKIKEFFTQLISMSICEVEKSVCAKLIKSGETIVECFECRVDESCIVCLECFQNGNHKGHRVLFKKAGGGCCDCGDTQAWREEGFCSKHSGKEKQIIIDQNQSRSSNEMLFELFYLYSFLKLTDNKSFNQFSQGFFALLTQMVKIGLKGIKLVANFLNSQLPKKLTVSSKLSGKVLQQLFNIEFSNDDFRYWQELFIEMFPYYTFKQQLIATYMKSFSSLYANSSQTGLSISCQIITSHKLVEDYADTNGAVPILVDPSQNIELIRHLSRMQIYDLDKITSLQGNAPLKYWKMQIKYGVDRIFGCYQSLKLLARKQKQKAAEAAQSLQLKDKTKKDKQTKIVKKKQKVKARKIEQNSDDDSQSEDKSFSILEFLKRHNKLIQIEHAILQQFLLILPSLAKQQELVSTLIKDLVNLILKQVMRQDDLIIFRPYQRMLALLLFYQAKQTPFLLTGESVRKKIREASGLSDVKWSWFLNAVQQRMVQTLTFYSYIQTHQNQNYHHVFYVYIVLYCSNASLLGYTDLLSIKQTILLGAPELTLNFKSLAKMHLYEQEPKWSLKMISNLVTQLGLIYTGYFPEIYIAHYSLKSQVQSWTVEETKTVLRKIITSLGGSANFQKIQEYCNSLITSNEDIIKNYLKTLCNFNKSKKLFELLPDQQDKSFINFKDFGLRAKNFDQSTEQMPPSSTLQLINRQNKKVLIGIWNKSNIGPLCSILLEILDQVQNKKSKDQILAFYRIPCKISVALKHSGAPQANYTSLTQMLQNLDVSTQVRKSLGPLASELPSIIENYQLNEQDQFAQKQFQRQKKLKKLEQLKKKKSQNLQKTKEIHQLAPTEIENNLQECAICRKSGGNLVWVSRLRIKNLEKIYGQGEGALTLSFTSCYHAFDYECVLENAIKRSSHNVLFRCPVCRTLGNVLINLNLTHQSQVYVDAILDRILHVTMTLRNYKELNIIEELLKGFYHYVLLGYAEPVYVKQRRMKLYQKIITLLTHLKDQSKIDSAAKNLEQHKIPLLPKVAAEQKQKIQLKDIEVMEIQSYSDQEFSDDQIWTIYRNRPTNEKKQSIQQKKKDKQKPKKNEEEEYSKIFYYTLRRIIDHIKAKRSQINKKQPVEENSKMMIEQLPEQAGQHIKGEIQQKKEIKTLKNTQVPGWVISLLDQLLQEKGKMQLEWNPAKVIELKILPEKYYWDMSENKCDYCDTICSDIFICLLCKWKGCLNSCKKGGIKRHNKVSHGENGAFLRLKDATAYLMSPGEIKKAGCLYTNEWGQDFNMKKDWNQYYLQTSLIDQAVGMLLKDE